MATRSFGRWNYRVVEGLRGFQIREAYYKGMRRTPQMTHAARLKECQTLEELRWQLEAMVKAFDRPLVKVGAK